MSPPQKEDTETQHLSYMRVVRERSCWSLFGSRSLWSLSLWGMFNIKVSVSCFSTSCSPSWLLQSSFFSSLICGGSGSSWYRLEFLFWLQLLRTVRGTPPGVSLTENKRTGHRPQQLAGSSVSISTGKHPAATASYLADDQGRKCGA